MDGRRCSPDVRGIEATSLGKDKRMITDAHNESLLFGTTIVFTHAVAKWNIYRYGKLL